METRRVRGPGFDRLQALINDANRLTLKVGFPSAAHYEDGTSVAQVAVDNEFGVPSQHIPPRPFMRPTAAAKRQEWTDNMGRGAAAAVRGARTLTQVLDQIGMMAAGDIAHKITQIVSPPLADLTVANRMNRYASNQAHVGNLTKPLIDTGLMFNSVTHEVGDDSGE